MINIYNLSQFLIYASVLSFYVPFGAKSISICEIMVPIFALLIFAQKRSINLKYTKQEFLFFIFSLSKIFIDNIITLLRINSAVIFLSSINFYKFDYKFFRTISNAFFNSLSLISIAGLFNILIGNVRWTSILLSFNLLPLNVTKISINSWWNNENGIVSFFVTQNMLVQYVFLIYILLLIMYRNNLLSKSKIRLSTFYTVLLLFFAKSSLGSFCLLLLFLFYLKDNLIKIIKDFLKRFINLKITFSNLFISSLFFFFIFAIVKYWRIINLQVSSAIIFLKGLISMDLINITYQVYDTSEFHRLKYAQLFLNNIDKCKLFGASSLIQTSIYNPHNFYLNIAHSYGLIPLISYLLFIFSLFFNGLKNKYISEIYKLLFIYIFFAGFQGDLFGDTRAILPLLFIIFILRNDFILKKIN